MILSFNLSLKEIIIYTENRVFVPISINKYILNGKYVSFSLFNFQSLIYLLFVLKYTFQYSLCIFQGIYLNI